MYILDMLIIILMIVFSVVYRREIKDFFLGGQKITQIIFSKPKIFSNKETVLNVNSCIKCPMATRLSDKLCCRAGEYKPIKDPSKKPLWCPYD